MQYNITIRSLILNQILKLFFTILTIFLHFDKKLLIQYNSCTLISTNLDNQLDNRS